MRGGGGSFGVVTAMEIALYPMPELYAGAMWWPWERASEVMHAWREWTLTVPDEVTSSARIMQIPPIPEIPEFLRGRNFVTIDAAIIGDRAFGAEAVQALRDLEPEIDTFDMVPPVALSRLHNDPEEPMPVMTEHRLLADLPAEAVDAFVAVAGPDSGSTLMMAEIRHLGGALGEIRPGHGALASLEAAYLFFGGGAGRDAGDGRGPGGGAAALQGRDGRVGRGPRLLQLRGDRGRLKVLLRRGHPPAPAPHQDAGRPGRHLQVQPPDRPGRVISRGRVRAAIP